MVSLLLTHETIISHCRDFFGSYLHVEDVAIFNLHDHHKEVVVYLYCICISKINVIISFSDFLTQEYMKVYSK